jgi:hypothetical protein
MSKAGYTPHGKEHVTLDQYVDELRRTFASVVVVPVALDSTGRQLENDVAIFVKRDSVK